MPDLTFRSPIVSPLNLKRKREIKGVKIDRGTDASFDSFFGIFCDFERVCI